MTSTEVRRAVLVFVPIILVAMGIIYLLYRAEVSASWSILQMEQRDLVEIGRHRVIVNLEAGTSDVMYLAGQEVMRQWLAAKDPAMLRNLAAEYLAFSANKVVYDKVRLLDLEGREVVRVDRKGKPRLTPDGQLQDMKDRDYVRETLKLGPGQVYVAPFDLTDEHGVIEQPVKPVIRFGAPVFDGEGRKQGLILLNYLGAGLLDRIGALTASGPGEFWLLNASGYWLLGPHPEDEWGFMYPDRQIRTLAQAYPEAWGIIQRNAASAQFMAGGDLFTYALVSPSEADMSLASNEKPVVNIVSSESWILVSHIPAQAIAALTAAPRRNFMTAFGVVAALLAVLSWIIARHQTARLSTEQQIRNSEARFRGMMNSAPDAVIVSNKNDEIVFSNMQAGQLYGYDHDELIGRNVLTLNPERHRVDHERRSVYFEAMRADGKENQFIRTGLHRDGTEFPIECRSTCMEIGQEILIFTACRDITGQIEAAKNLQELNDRLARDNTELDALNRELEAFSYSVSHDLRAPLRAIDGFSQALLEDYADRLDDSGRNYLSRVRKAAQRMGELIDDLLKLARITRGEMNTGEVDLSALVEEILNRLRQDDPGRAAEFIIAPGLTVHGDPRFLRIAMENLLNNAWKFTAGKTPARIAFGQTERNGAPAYFVRDNGVGFNMAHAGKLFGAFQRMHDASAFPGTGIGLAIVQRIIRKHGGNIWAEATPDQGAAFYFTL